MILFRVQLRIPPAVRDRVVQSLLRMAGPARAVKGCTACGVFMDVEDDNTLLYVEEWETQAAVDERLRAEDLRVLLSALDLSSEPPVVRFEAVGETQGMEVIAAARAGTGR
ncbi:MAG: antibiotic biosynthesis monooxygenase [Phycisphaerae bacterium]|nr:antibiotic biosynthesis monooxygenase [Phycisphaerae bacterium]